MEYELYVCDTETTGLTNLHGVIELSIRKFHDNVQKTWFLKPFDQDLIDLAALRVNGHKLEDIKHQTKYGRDTYLNPAKIIVEIENWLAEDGLPTAKRIMVGHNVGFDRMMMESLWSKLNASDSFPFSYRIMDTQVWSFMMDYAMSSFGESYNLATLIKKYGIKNEKAHSAEADVKATSELFKSQVNELRNKLGIKV